jgi:ketosteroid isomerase-like protein
MSQENVDLVRSIYAALDRGDAEAVEALLEGRVAPDYELHPLYFDRVYKGADAIQQLLADISETWEDYRQEVEEIVDLGEHLLVLARMTARGAGGGVPIDERIAMLLRFQGETLVWSKSFSSKSEALEAVGLRE